MVELPNCWTPERSVAMMLVPLLGTAAISSILFGIVSDHLGKRKPVVIVAGKSADQNTRITILFNVESK